MSKEMVKYQAASALVKSDPATSRSVGKGLMYSGAGGGALWLVGSVLPFSGLLIPLLFIAAVLYGVNLYAK